jgi:hypothetical protein
VIGVFYPIRFLCDRVSHRQARQQENVADGILGGPAFAQDKTHTAFESSRQTARIDEKYRPYCKKLHGSFGFYATHDDSQGKTFSSSA